MQDMLRTDQTYANRNNAKKKLDTEIAKLGDVGTVRFVIAVNEEGRFAPIVFADQYNRHDLIALIHHGITVVG